MSRDTGDALRRAAAIDVMAWRVADVAWASAPDEPVWHDESGTPLVPVEAWRPDLDEAQCASIVETMVARGHAFSLESGADGYVARFGAVTRSHPDRRVAILLAATGFDPFD